MGMKWNVILTLRWIDGEEFEQPAAYGPTEHNTFVELLDFIRANLPDGDTVRTIGVRTELIELED